MNEKVSTILARAHQAISDLADHRIEKTMWGSPAGKKKLAKRLVAMLPPHKTYVEPFCGSGAVLFEKEPAQVEVINDADQEIVQAYRLVKRLTVERLNRLRRMNWVGDAGRYKRIYDSRPKGDVAKLHRFLYVTHFSYGRMRGRSFNPSAQGVKANTVKRIEKFGPRLKNVTIHGGDYERVIRQYDSSSTTFFLDPPYVGYDARVGESKFDEENFFKVLKGTKGKFLLTYGIKGKLPGLLEGSGFHIKRIRTRRDIRAMRGAKGPSMLTQLVVTNYAPVKKQLDCLTDEVEEDLTKPEDIDFIKEVPLIKGEDPEDERYVLGIVLEPEVVDAQGDIYSAEEIRQAAHRFMEEFGGLGLMHRFRVGDQVKILESYIAPVDFEIAGTRVRSGTWLLAVRILSDELWEQVKDGVLTGFSIGGSARGVPERSRTQEGEAA